MEKAAMFRTGSDLVPDLNVMISVLIARLTAVMSPSFPLGLITTLFGYPIYNLILKTLTLNVFISRELS